MALVLNTDETDEKYYIQFINDLRHLVIQKYNLKTENESMSKSRSKNKSKNESKGKGKGKSESSESLPPLSFYTLPPTEKIKISDEYFTCALTALNNSRRLILLIKGENLYIVAMSRGDNGQWIVFTSDDRETLENIKKFLKHMGEKNLEFHRKSKVITTLRDSYKGLEEIANTHRKNILLGQHQLRQAVITLTDVDESAEKQAKSLLVVIQMISESMRMKGITNELVESYGTGKIPSDKMIDFETNWSRCSKILLNNDNITPFSKGGKTYTLKELLDFVSVVKTP